MFRLFRSSDRFCGSCPSIRRKAVLTTRRLGRRNRGDLRTMITLFVSRLTLAVLPIASPGFCRQGERRALFRLLLLLLGERLDGRVERLDRRLHVSLRQRARQGASGKQSEEEQSGQEFHEGGIHGRGAREKGRRSGPLPRVAVQASIRSSPRRPSARSARGWRRRGVPCQSPTFEIGASAPHALFAGHPHFSTPHPPNGGGQGPSLEADGGGVWGPECRHAASSS
jgi:hypothetical protein